jgi:hypothetical protein
MRIGPALALLQATACAAAVPIAVDIGAGPAPVALIELYTSEGCSSCPPGEAWLSNLAEAGGLWRDFVPVAFHVDYWDRLGWRDPLGSPAHSDRQRRYASEWRSRSVYTPGFVLHGREWSTRRRDLNEVEDANGGGTLRVAGALPGSLEVKFSGLGSGPWVAQVAILGGGINVDVPRGENSGRRLRHDFAVLTWRDSPLDAEGHAQIEFSALPEDHGAQRLAIAVWIERPGSPAPVQAAGGWLDIVAAP